MNAKIGVRKILCKVEKWCGALAMVLALLSVLWGLRSIPSACAHDGHQKGPDLILGSWLSWFDACERYLIVRGQGPHWVWDEKTRQHDRSLLREYLNHPAFGLEILLEWLMPEFKGRTKKDQFEVFAKRWEVVFRAKVFPARIDSEGFQMVTHSILMPTGVTFERIVFHRGTGKTILLPDGKTIQDPGFGDLGVAWRVLRAEGDNRSSLLWSAPLPGSYTWHEANQVCARWGGRLPTKEEYEELVKQLGQYETSYGAHHLNNLTGFDKEWYWSSSVQPDKSDDVYCMYGLSGSVCDITRLIPRSVRCVR